MRERYQRDAVKFTPHTIMQMAELLLQTQKELKFLFEYQFRFELALLKLLDIAHPPVVATTTLSTVPEKKKPLSNL